LKNIFQSESPVLFLLQNKTRDGGARGLYIAYFESSFGMSLFLAVMKNAAILFRIAALIAVLDEISGIQMKSKRRIKPPNNL